MAGHNNDAPSMPPPVYQLPEWETITHPPKPRQSLLGRILPSKEDPDEHLAMSARPSTALDHEQAKEPPDRASTTLPMYNSPATKSDTAKPSLIAPLRKRLDSVFPPHRTYFGRSRRFFFLFIVLPAVIFVFLLVPLAIGLGVGLSRRHSGSQNLPLPSNKDIFTGELTYYDPALGACGIQSNSYEDIVSVSHIIFDATSQGNDPNTNSLCGMRIRVTRDFVEAGAGNRSVDVVVVDRCVGCQATDLDLSLSVFTQLAPQDSGKVVGSWAWLS
ncbi:uncharacterized protein F4822DRAFT_236406 [Hypoxylon trugodes]|uniref:uncharacterized protein n=1 Tax=Hypoxylon trugodes TaxID=326681 RepID=UPI002194CE9F|nr:uncharacterized protein F4822DRAFT_236406 [Hypoxylon trugodes]KAI1388162.1 hypothetical protein F4822DRAFT_236406 [Hypoxylon trugodes]